MTDAGAGGSGPSGPRRLTAAERAAGGDAAEGAASRAPSRRRKGSVALASRVAIGGLSLSVTCGIVTALALDAQGSGSTTADTVNLDVVPATLPPETTTTTAPPATEPPTTIVVRQHVVPASPGTPAGATSRSTSRSSGGTGSSSGATGSPSGAGAAASAPSPATAAPAPAPAPTPAPKPAPAPVAKSKAS